MKICKTSVSSEPRLCKAYLNFSINPETIPTLISAEKLRILQEGDENPYYVPEEIIDITKPVKGVEFTTEFWYSFLEKLKNAPLPGSKSGHTSPWEWWITGDMDFFTIGGEIRGNNVYLKMYIPPEGYKSNNATFIKTIKTGMVHFSIVSWTKDIIKYDEEGEIESIKAVESVKGERNDAAERDMGAMEQHVHVNKEEYNRRKSDKKQEKECIMGDLTYDQIITKLKNSCVNGDITKPQICKDLGIEFLDYDMNVKLELVNQAEKILGKNWVEKIKEMKENEINVKQEAYENLRARLMRDVFGDPGTEEKPNLKRQAAEPHVSMKIQDEKSLKAEIEKAKENPVVKSISFQRADINSEMNDLTGVKSSPNNGYRSEIIKI